MALPLALGYGSTPQSEVLPYHSGGKPPHSKQLISLRNSQALHFGS